ncbi:hypothetical protein CDO87_03375 [Sagittula sp. P11]|uniref:hypothetical protein n=1 Tax=Sagittula sp. P11 TaxID=2009329 RepID=UPI000C2D23B8|nr:hypothetical protein [Sagittula sp. P11]AUC52287.1 hypothetical protein CDO87_03375 [Sagittula sp. P11]
MIAVSYVLVPVNVISAVLLAALVMQLRWPLRINFTMRLFSALLSVSLLMHAAEQVQLIHDYRPPRALSWIPVYFGMHGLIWSAAWRVFVRRP